MSEARTHLLNLTRRVNAGKEITITKRGKPVAKLSRVSAPKRRQFGLHARELSTQKIHEAARPLTDEQLEDWQQTFSLGKPRVR